MIEAKTSKRITILGLVFSCVIVVYHARDSYPAVGSLDAYANSALLASVEAMAYLAMSYFFCTTGFLLFSSLTFANFKQKMKQRVRSLLIPYLVWQLLALVIRYPDGMTWDIETFVRTVFFFEMGAPDGPLWYVYGIFLLALLSPLLLYVFKNKTVAFVFVAFVSLFFVPFIQDYNLLGPFADTYMSNIVWYLPSYLFGAFFGYFFREEGLTLDSLKYAAYIMFGALMTEGLITGRFEEIALRILPVFLLYFFPVTQEKIHSPLFKLSFTLYALHGPVMWIVWRAVDGLAFMFDCAFFINVAGMVLILTVDVALAAILYFGLLRFAPKVLGILTGGRIR